MANVNTVILAGNLTRDPETRQVGSSGIVCRLGLAVNRRYRDRNNESREETTFVDIETWGRQAETCDRYLRKGAPVLVEGRLKLDQWEDKNTGQRRSRMLVVGERVHFLGRPGDGDYGRGGSSGREGGYNQDRGGEDNQDRGGEDNFDQRRSSSRSQTPPPFPGSDQGNADDNKNQDAFDVDQDNDESIDDIPF